MKIFLTKQCESITGSLGSEYGYHIQKRKNGFFAKRNSKSFVPPNGHWLFILACARLANARLHVSDIEIHWSELFDALCEGYHFVAAGQVDRNGREAKKLFYNTDAILNLKTTFDL